MKKIILMLMAFCTVVACENGGNDTTPKEITLDSGTELNQSLYADETSKNEGVKFSTTGAWTAEVKEVDTKATADTPNWITLSQYSGDKAGDYSISITLQKNTTGKNRKANITIICGDTTLTITVEQKGVTEEGTIPDEPITPTDKLISRIENVEDYVGGYSGSEITDYTYDNTNRLTEIKATVTETNTVENITTTFVTTTAITYGGNTISYVINETKNGGEPYKLGEAAAQLNSDGYISTCNVKRWEYKETDEYFDEENFTLSYDGDNYLTKCTFDDNSIFTTTWDKKNVSKVLWEGGSDWAEYTTSPNKTNIDLNWLIALNSEGFDFSVGEPDKIFAMLGYTGKRSANLVAKSFSKYGDSSEEKYEFAYTPDNNEYPTKIVKTYWNSMTNKFEHSSTYLITYK